MKKPAPKIEHYTKGAKNYTWDLGEQAFGKKEPQRKKKKDEVPH